MSSSWSGHALCAVAFAALVPHPRATAQSETSAPTQTWVVTATRTPQPLSSVLADVSVLEREDIDRAGVSSVADLLSRLPGVEFTRNGGPSSATSIFIRGSETRHTAVYIDGVRVDSQFGGGAAWEQLPLDQVDRIEVLRGPAAVIYGSDAMGGVVQLFTKRGRGPARTTASLTVGSHDTVQGQVGVSGSSAPLNYSLSAAHGLSAGFDAKTPGSSGHHPDKDGWERSSVRGRVGWQINANHQLDAAMLASNLKSSFDNAGAADERNIHALRTGHIAWLAQWNERASTRLQAGEMFGSFATRPGDFRTETTLTDFTLLHEQRFESQRLSVTVERREDKLSNIGAATRSGLTSKRHQDAVGLGWRADVGEHGLQAHARHDEGRADSNPNCNAWLIVG